jgi:hypothetical protein
VKKFISILSVAVLWVVVPSWAQLSSPNDAGVVMGHLHLNSRDVEASKKFWTELGGTPMNKGPFTIMKFPGVLVFLNLTAPTPSTGGSEGSVVNHVGFNVPNVQASLAKWQAAGLKAATVLGVYAGPSENRDFGRPIANCSDCHTPHSFLGSGNGPRWR